MTEKEKQAVEEEGNRRFGKLLGEGYDASDLFEAYINGAEFLSELRKPSEDLVGKIAELIEADLLQSYAPNFYDEDDGRLSLLDLFSHTDTIDSGRKNIEELVDGMDCIEEIANLVSSYRQQETGSNGNIDEVKNTVAKSKGYPSWKVMFDWIVDHNNSCNASILIESAMDEVVTLASSSRQQENDAGFEKLVLKEEPVEYRKDGLR